MENLLGSPLDYRTITGDYKMSKRRLRKERRLEFQENPAKLTPYAQSVIEKVLKLKLFACIDNKFHFSTRISMNPLTRWLWVTDKSGTKYEYTIKGLERLLRIHNKRQHGT